jgi:aldehyde:ferredoxin oxidoreductase
MGGTLAFARECVERGLLEMPAIARPASEYLLDMIDLTARREGPGALLALGSRELARRVGQGSEAFAPHVKGLEMPGYHPGALQTLGLGFAVGARGADHNKSSAYDLDLSGEVDRFSLDPQRIAAMVKLENDVTLMDSLILCKFVRRAVHDLYADGAAMLAAVTGMGLAPEDLVESARRIHHAKKLFNQLQGWDAREDTLPARFFAPAAEEAAQPAPASPGPRGPGKPALTIDPRQFQEAKTQYYRLRGWGPDGRLTSAPDMMRNLQLL